VFARQWLLILSIVLGLPSMAQAQGMPCLENHCDRRDWVAQQPNLNREPPWLKSLNLSPNQQRRMQAISQLYRPQIDQRKQMLLQLKAELQGLMASDASAAQIREKHNQVESLAQEIRQLRFESILSMREVLTPEQRRQFDAYMRDRKPNRRSHHFSDR
jgi:Spy/CpxP family protein refolding chaperone